MVGLFSRFSGGRNGHRRTQTAIDLSTSSATNTEVTGSTLMSSVSHGAAVPLEFKPVEHPTEPLNHDQPVKCPLPEPSILNDGQIWKERMSANARARDLSAARLGGNRRSFESETSGSKRKVSHSILPSQSAPEHSIINLLEECNAAGI